MPPKLHWVAADISFDGTEYERVSIVSRPDGNLVIRKRDVLLLERHDVVDIVRDGNDARHINFADHSVMRVRRRSGGCRACGGG